jgi:class 3 adenylate cyclase
VAPRREEVGFVVGLPPPRVWDVVSDTQHINELVFGLSAGSIIERSATRARVRGTFGLLAPEYDEYPWVFEVPRCYRNERVFTRGALQRLATTCALEEERAGTRVRYVLEVEGRGPLGGVASAVVVWRMRRGLQRLEAMLGAMTREPDRGVVWPPANPWREETLARARPLLARLPASPVVDKLAALLADATDADVSRMRPFALASTWATPRQETLEVFLRAAHAGLLRLSWDLVCPACEGAVSVGHLRDLPANVHCSSCDLDFGSAFAENVEATFSPEPTIRAATHTVFCLGSPSSTRSWLAQRVLKPGESITLSFQLGSGRYRLQAAGVQGTAAFDVADEGVDAVSTTLDAAGFTPIPRLKAGPVSVRIDNADVVERRIQLVHRAFASEAATAADVTSLGLFRELFGQEVLAPDQHVSVGRMAILFTDLVGSTAMYERLGDAAAYGLVRRHFDLLRAAITRHYGRVVKTVGDAVMASFDLPRDAVEAGLACIAALRTLRGADGSPSGLRLKVGVHAGACLAIEANGSTDYFGRTVNVAARVESLARPDELVASWAVLADEAAAAAIDAAVVAGATLARDRCQVKGVADEVEVVRLTLPEQP